MSENILYCKAKKKKKQMNKSKKHRIDPQIHRTNWWLPEGVEAMDRVGVWIERFKLLDIK